ncbi:DNA cytosine methyltransferase [Sphingomonas sp. 3-13AW]|uniref:DNA cytosine methyltransferase n=1 Tax=Sphingomonas sp. 3-13AW TaxID=3050450 RepID=UPI003BB6DA5A
MTIDLFAGGGGASVGIEKALGRPVSLALNHNPYAVALHAVNHPKTRHICQDIETADPIKATRGRPVFLLWASPSCTQFSRGRHALPAERQLREMGWRVLDWVRATRPVVVCMENVVEYLKWGPLNADGYPIREREGETWNAFVQAFRDLGYSIDWTRLNAADCGAPTARHRLFVQARRDGHPIRWPEPTHGPQTGRPWKRTADFLDWSQEAPSIFNRKKDLVPATMERIFQGFERFIVNDPDPYIAPPEAKISRNDNVDLVSAFLTQNNTGMVGRDVRQPLSTLTSKACNQSLVLAYMTRLRNNAVGSSLGDPLATICASGAHHAEIRVSAYAIKYYSEGGVLQDLRQPVGTITTRDRFAVVTIHGNDYVVSDIGFRFLTDRELFDLQGFNRDFLEGREYQIDLIANGKPLTGKQKKLMVGNSVAPPAAAAVVSAAVAPYSDESFSLPLAA